MRRLRLRKTRRRRRRRVGIEVAEVELMKPERFDVELAQPLHSTLMDNTVVAA